jgi:hypothetical protein
MMHSVISDPLTDFRILSIVSNLLEARSFYKSASLFRLAPLTVTVAPVTIQTTVEGEW